MADPPNRANWSDPSTWVQGRRARLRPTRGRILVLIALVALAAIVSRSCQQSQIRVSQAEAIAIAKRQIDFEPKSTQIRLLRQGLNRKPFWFVSMSDPVGSAINPKGYTRLAVVEIDANTGKVEDVNSQGAPNPAPAKQGKKDQARAGSKGP